MMRTSGCRKKSECSILPLNFSWPAWTTHTSQHHVSRRPEHNEAPPPLWWCGWLAGYRPSNCGRHAQLLVPEQMAMPSNRKVSSGASGSSGTADRP